MRGALRIVLTSFLIAAESLSRNQRVGLRLASSSEEARDLLHTWGQLQRTSWKVLRGVAALALSLPLVTAPASAAGPQLKLAREHARASEQFRLRVFVSSDVPLGAYTLQLSFAPAALELTSVSGGSGEFAAQPITNPEKFSSGVVRFSAFQPTRMDGPMGLCHVATLSFTPRATKGSTRVEVEVITIADTLGSTYPRTTRHRTLRFRGR